MSEGHNVIKDFVREVKLGTENLLSVAKEVNDDGEKLTTIAMQNRQLQPEPPREAALARSPKRAHTFHEAAGLGEYLGKYGGNNTVVLADVRARKMEVVLDESAIDGFEVLDLIPRIHPLFLAWYGLKEHQVEIKVLAQFLLEHRREITDPDPMTLLADFSQLRGTSKITTESGTVTAKNHHCLNGVMVETTIKGVNNKELVELPNSITVKAPLYLGTEPQDFTFDLTLRVDPNNNEIVAKLTSADLEEAEVNAFEEMMQTIREQIAGIAIFGSVEHSEWRTLPG